MNKIIKKRLKMERVKRYITHNIPYAIKNLFYTVYYGPGRVRGAIGFLMPRYNIIG